MSLIHVADRQFVDITQTTPNDNVGKPHVTIGGSDFKMDTNSSIQQGSVSVPRKTVGLLLEGSSLESAYLVEGQPARK